MFLPRLGTVPSAFHNSKSHFIAEPIKGSVNNLETLRQQDATGGERWNSKQGRRGKINMKLMASAYNSEKRGKSCISAQLAQKGVVEYDM